MLGYGICQVFRLAQSIVLSYLVVPEIFGLFTLLNICLQGLFMFSELGVGPSIVQHERGDEQSFLNTAWTIQILRSFVLWGVTCLAAWPFAHFYDQRLLWLLPITGIAAMFDGFTSTSVYTVQRKMLIGRLVLLDVGAQLLGSVVACVWAWYSPSVLALLSATLVAMSTRMAVSHFLLPGGVRNRPHWDWGAFHEVFTFGKWILLSTMVAFCAMQVDRLVLGRLVDHATLGIYGVAWAISMLPVVSMQKLCANVLHPLLSQYQRDSGQEMRTQFYRVRGALLAIGVFLVMGIYAGAEIFFAIVYHENFHDAGHIAKLLSVSTWVSAVTATVVRAVFVVGSNHNLAISSFVKFCTTAIASIAGFQLLGLDGFILGLVIGNLCGYAVLLWSLRSVDIRCLRQDLKYSGLFLVSAVFVDIGGEWLSRAWSHGELAVAVAGCIAIGVWAVHKMRQLARMSTVGSAATTADRTANG